MTETKRIAIELDAENAKAGLRQVTGLEHEATEAGESMGSKLTEGFEKAHGSARHLAGGMLALSGAFGDSAIGMGKVVQEMGHIAGLASVGGPLPAAIGLVAFTFGELAEQQKAAQEASKKWSEFIETSMKGNVKDLLTSLHALNEELDIIGKKGVTMQYAAAEAGKKQAEVAKKFYEDDTEKSKARLDELQHDIKLNTDAGLVAFVRRDQAEKESVERGLTSDKIHLENAEREIELTGQQIDAMDEVLQKNTIAEMKAKAKQAALDEYAKQTAAILAEPDVDANNDMSSALDIVDPEKLAKQKEAARATADQMEQQARAKLYAELRAQALKQQEWDEQMADETAEYKIKKDQEVANRRAEESKQIAASLSADATAAANAGAEAVGTFIEASINGNKYAAQEAEAAFAKSIGQQLVGMGIKDAFAGAGFMIAGDLPQGAAMLALAAAEEAAGIGLGAVAAGITKSIPTSTKTKGAGERGINSSSGSSSGGGGSSGPRMVTMVNYWGSGGPGADDYARSTADQLVRAQKRGYL